MEAFSALLALCAGNSPVPAEFSSQRPVTRSFDVFFDLRLNKRLNKQWAWRFETLSRLLWRHCNVELFRRCQWSNPDKCGYINSLWTSDAIWRQGSRSTLVQRMACCLMAPSHYLNQCWLIITKVQWYSSEGNFTWDITATSPWNQLENYFSKILLKSPWGPMN